MKETEFDKIHILFVLAEARIKRLQEELDKERLRLNEIKDYIEQQKSKS